MIFVGLTGGIGSGKSYIAIVFQALGIPVYEADLRARELSNNNPEIRKKIIDIFGSEAYKENLLDRKWIGSQVFRKADLLQKLNEIIHPEVDKDFRSWCSDKQEFPYVLKEAAILFETGSYRKLNFNILVTAPESIRIERVARRDSLEPGQIRKRMENQWDDDKKQKLADFVIVNDGNSLILPQIISIDQKIRKKI